MAELPHFQYPFRRGPNGKVAVVEQDTPEHVDSCLNVIIRCPLGFRDALPEFGWPFPEFQSMPIDPSGLKRALQIWEERAHVRVEAWEGTAELAVQHMSVTAEVDVDG
jgi:phage baseplate assembly protein W